MAAPSGNTQPITNEELNQLPHEAVVALAARYALRIIPLIADKQNEDFWRKDAKKNILSVENAIKVAILFSLNKKNKKDAFSASGPAAIIRSTPAASASYAAYASANTDDRSTATSIVLASINANEITDAYRDNILFAQRWDYNFLAENVFANKELQLEVFYQLPMWPEESRSEQWYLLEQNFLKTLKGIDYAELFKRYQSGGSAYLTEERANDQFQQSIDTQKAAEPQVEEAEDVSLDIPPYLSDSVFSIHTHRVEPALGVEKQANIIAGLLENFQDEKGQFVGIFGQWGRGKTYFWEQVQKYLESSERQLYKMANFQAWRYQDTPASWAYLYETLARCYYDSNKFGKILLALKRGHWKKPLYALLLSVALDVAAHLLIPSAIGFGYIIFSTSIIWNYIVKKEYSTKAVDIFQKLTKKVSFEGFLGTQAEIQKEMIILFKTWFPDPRKKKLLLFVDDIDRCDEDRIIQIVDAIRVMLDDEELVKRLVVVAAVDERILMRAIRNKYYDLVFKSRLGTIDERKRQLEALTREYMDKLFITGIKLPQLTADELKQYLYKLAKKLRVRPKLKQTLEEEAPKEQIEKQINIESSEAEIQDTQTELKNDDHPEEEAADELKEPEKYDLTTEELEVIEETLLHLPRSATPRQIRIFTYRYMMAIRLFKTTSRYESLSFEKGIFNIEENRLIAFMILEYGLMKSVHELMDLKRDLLFVKGDNVKFKTMEQSFTRSKDYMRQVFEVLEMVIAY